MLVTSELGEAMESHRKNKFADLSNFRNAMNTTHDNDESAQQYFKTIFEGHIKDTFQDEIADAIIRLYDLSAGLGIDIEEHINLKVAYNKTRERLHGKSY